MKTLTRRTLDPDGVEAVDLEISNIRTLLDMTDTKLNEILATPVEWLYFRDALRGHLDVIDALLRDPPVTLCLEKAEGEAVADLLETFSGQTNNPTVRRLGRGLDQVIEQLRAG
jgi:hypothetical protein